MSVQSQQGIPLDIVGWQGGVSAGSAVAVAGPELTCWRWVQRHGAEE